MDIKLKERIDSIISGMTLNEKIGQLNQEAVSPKDLEKIKERVRNGELGSIILASTATAGNDAQEKVYYEVIDEIQKTAVEESRMGIPLLFGRDIIHGYTTVFPVPLALSAMFNPDLVKTAYSHIAKETKNNGVNWTFAPMIDISRDSRWGRCIEGIGEDPYVGGVMAEAIVKGFQGEELSPSSVAATAKHFIGYGAAEGGRDYDKTEISDYTLRNFYLPPFKKAIDAGCATVMNSFNEINGTSTAASKKLLRKLLKDELSFEGFVISDWGSVEKLVFFGQASDKKEAAKIAINAGMDMDMVCRAFFDNLEALVSEGKVSEETINEAVSRILGIKLKLGLFENPYVVRQKIDIEETEDCAEKCADEAMVLLKNNENILPLKKEAAVLFAGPMLSEKHSLMGSWSADGDVTRVKSIKEALKERKVNAFFAESDYLWDGILPFVRMADAVVLTLGESRKVTGEANSLTKVELPAEQLEFIKRVHALGVKIIGVMAFGRPIALSEAEPYLDAILYIWHSGTRSAQSAVSALYGDVNPSGRLPMSFPRYTGQIPIYYNREKGAIPLDSYYGETNKRVHSYHDSLATPMYPFGYGLSYTEFSYGEITSDKTKISLKDLEAGDGFSVSITVKNTGEREGAEVTQVYITDKVSSMVRPIKELKAFSKNVLKPGEEVKLNFFVDFEKLGYYNDEGEFTVEEGKFDIWIGKDAYVKDKITVRVE
ncbi:MAG: glycoside hydrolase family 3 N-terminal domain-containing protein [Clostridia bacterium]|nr:glycoside hydrolase family 3 N-terminal domain-containing protein [Clostridia bacterium]